LLGFVVKRTDEETRQGRGVVRGSGHSPFRLLVLNERTEFNSLYPQRNRLMKEGVGRAKENQLLALRAREPFSLRSRCWAVGCA
jgi:hypothetical protein